MITSKIIDDIVEYVLCEFADINSATITKMHNSTTVDYKKKSFDSSNPTVVETMVFEVSDDKINKVCYTPYFQPCVSGIYDIIMKNTGAAAIMFQPNINPNTEPIKDVGDIYRNYSTNLIREISASMANGRLTNDDLISIGNMANNAVKYMLGFANVGVPCTIGHRHLWLGKYIDETFKVANAINEFIQCNLEKGLHLKLFKDAVFRCILESDMLFYQRHGLHRTDITLTFDECSPVVILTTLNNKVRTTLNNYYRIQDLVTSVEIMGGFKSCTNVRGICYILMTAILTVDINHDIWVEMYQDLKHIQSILDNISLDDIKSSGVDKKVDKLCNLLKSYFDDTASLSDLEENIKSNVDRLHRTLYIAYLDTMRSRQFNNDIEIIQYNVSGTK